MVTGACPLLYPFCDAYLIQCALQTSTPLLILDKGLKIASEKMGIHTLEVES